jgi:hypothetical protein
MLAAKSMRADRSSERRPPIIRLSRAAGRILLVAACLVLAINVLAVAAILGEGVVGEITRGSGDKRAALPNYREFDWAKTHFREFAELSTEYESFYGWRRLPYQGQTINIDENGIRRTFQDPGARPTRTIAIFGGSTAWGSGSDDDHTIASLFARARPDYRAYNFGETAHTAQQNLNFLVKTLAEGFRPDVVVFYNGSSEINKCRIGLDAFSDLNEPRIRELLDDDAHSLQGSKAFWSLVYPAKLFWDKLQPSLHARLYGPQDRRDCAENPEKAAMIARTLFWDWMAAKRLVEGYGGRFVAALQPVAYFGQPRTDHITIDAELMRQYEAVYSQYDRLLQDEFPALAPNFLDLRRAFDGDEYLYIDADHASPGGNLIVAARIGEHLSAP